MAGRKTRPRRNQGARHPAAAPVIYAARLGTNGAVIRVPPPIDRAQAILIRQAGGEVVVCGPDKAANSALARDIEQTANGLWRRCKPHANAGPNALPHYQPNLRGPAGHTFYETDTRHPL